MKIIDTKIVELLKVQPQVTLGFSGGKDSVTCLSHLLDMKIKVTPIFFFDCPEIKFVERRTKMYEDIFGIEIIRLPHPILYDYLRHQDFQPPEMIWYLDGMDFVKTSFEELTTLYMTSIGNPKGLFDVNGMKMAESLNRRLVLRKNEGINLEKKTISMIYDWTSKDVKEYLAYKKIPLADDYKIWRRSYDGVKYQYLFGVKEHYPEDWQTLCEYFPLLPLELFRYETNIKYFPK